MDIKVQENEENQQPSNKEIEQPLLDEHQDTSKKPSKTKAQKAIHKTFKGTARLSSLLPTGSVLIFEFLSPIFTNKGRCKSLQNQLLTILLLVFCAVSCFVMRFTDSIKDAKGKIRYGFITFKGLWIADGSVKLSPEESAEYRIGFRDCFHAVLTVVVFIVVALFDQNVVGCFYPEPSEEMKDMLVNVPAVVGIICTGLFVLFPSKRHAVTRASSKH